MASHEVNSSALTAGETYNFAALIVDTVNGEKQYNITSALSGYSAYTPGVDEATKITFASTQFTNGSGWQSAGTPEPTSGLLLLLGGAMLALRRKQK